MNPPPATLVTSIVVYLAGARAPAVRRLALEFLIQLLRDDDPLTRWGTVDCLLRTPTRLYLAPLLERLQEEDQSPELRACLNGLRKIAYRGYPATSAEVVRMHARLKFSLYLLADLRPRDVLKPEG